MTSGLGFRKLYVCPGVVAFAYFMYIWSIWLMWFQIACIQTNTNGSQLTVTLEPSVQVIMHR